MRKTIVTFSLCVPIGAPMTATSASLDQLVATWRTWKGVVGVRLDWKSFPNTVSKPPWTAFVDANVEIEAETTLKLRQLYEELSCEANKSPGRLSGRGCILTDMFD